MPVKLSELSMKNSCNRPGESVSFLHRKMLEANRTGISTTENEDKPGKPNILCNSIGWDVPFIRRIVNEIRQLSVYSLDV